jgi:hypothetical protein
MNEEILDLLKSAYDKDTNETHTMVLSGLTEIFWKHFILLAKTADESIKEYRRLNGFIT